MKGASSLIWVTLAAAGEYPKNLKGTNMKHIYGGGEQPRPIHFLVYVSGWEEVQWRER